MATIGLTFRHILVLLLIVLLSFGRKMSKLMVDFAKGDGHDDVLRAA